MALTGNHYCSGTRGKNQLNIDILAGPELLPDIGKSCFQQHSPGTGIDPVIEKRKGSWQRFTLLYRAAAPAGFLPPDIFLSPEDFCRGP